MASWYSNLVTKTSSQISSLRSTLLASDADGDTEDDTHVCRVLRNYYADKGRPRPSWLPADPKAADDPQLGTTARYGSLQHQQMLQQQQQHQHQHHQQHLSGGGASVTSVSSAIGLSSLWGDANSTPPARSATPAGVGGSGGDGRADAPTRPGLAQQRLVGSFQSVVSQVTAAHAGTAGGGGGGGGTGGTGGAPTAQDRLKQKLWGAARAASPALAASPASNQINSPFGPPQTQQGGGGGGGGGYARGPTSGARQGLPHGPGGYL